MHFFIRLTIAVLLAITLGVNSVIASVLYSQASDQRGGFVSDNIDTKDYIADDFILTQDSILTDVHWYGLYGDQSTVTSAQFRIQLFMDLAGAPLPVPQDNAFVTATVTAPATDTGTTSDLSNAPIMLFDVDPFQSVNLLGGQRYWVSIVETDPTTDKPFFWASAADARMAFRTIDSGPWTRGGETNVNLAFTLTGHTIPEPTTLALMGLGLAGIGYKRHRSKKAV